MNYQQRVQQEATIKSELISNEAGEFARVTAYNEHFTIVMILKKSKDEAVTDIEHYCEEFTLANQDTPINEDENKQLMSQAFVNNSGEIISQAAKLLQ